MLICNMAAASFEKGETLADRLEHLYEKYGYGFEQTISCTLEGKEGIEKIGKCMVELRKELSECKDLAGAGKLLGGATVLAVRDYKESKRYEFTADGVKVTDITLPKSNVLLYELGGGKGIDWACARPSGTEPKLKIYLGAYDADKSKAQASLDLIKSQVEGYVKSKLV